MLRLAILLLTLLWHVRRLLSLTLSTERSQFWTTGTTGDGTTTISEAQTIEWFRDATIPFASSGPNTSQGVLLGVLNELAVSGASSPVSVATGAAVVEGYYYKNDAAVSVAIATPAASTRVDVIVLRASHSTTRTVRITRIAGTEGAGAPAITQTAGTTWDIPLANVSITTGGVITITDRRTFAYFATKVKTAMLDDNSISNAKLRDSAGISVIGRSAASTGDPADIVASVDGHVLEYRGGVVGFGTLSTPSIDDTAITDAKLALRAALSVMGRAANSSGAPGDISTAAGSGAVLRESGSALAFGTVATAGIANDAVDDTKAGNRVPQFYRRQGGDASAWATPGTTTYTPTSVRMQAGAVSATVGIGQATQAVTITFPVAFSNTPIVTALVSSANPLNSGYSRVTLNTISATQVQLLVSVTAPPNPAETFTVYWFAVGPE